ncbi:MAG: MFS transporter [Candidatus Abyssobacteria bacterium SURF_17]|jgi:MFS family permease|uniref:MFS transporter n=1 Tax=Candidatus Abyssobacteria bacterium SURF_17 TaxID=2093361 RepID=A0A419EP00_9BACT|nr:MAG: MFS transporter [Candidatus Abyssubacteria bacterium SURF_17]
MTALPDTETSKLSSNVRALGWVSLLSDVHSETILPLLPLFVTQVLGLNKSFLGLIEGVADSTASLLKVVSGWYSDRIRHRKKPTAAGYILSTVTKPLLALSATGFHVLAIRFVDRVGKGIRTAPRDALIADSASTGSLGRAYGFHRMMDTLGAVAGTLLAYVMFRMLGGSEGDRMRIIFLIATVFGIAAVVILLTRVREPEQPITVDIETDDPGSDSRQKRLAAFVGVNAIFHLGMFSYAFFLLRAQSIGLHSTNIPLIYLLYNIVYAVTSLPLGRLSDAIGRKPLILLAYCSYAVLCLGLAFAAHVWQAWLLFALYGIHSATVNTASRALVAQLSEVRSRATALGIYHTSVGIAVLPASLIAGVLWDRYGARAPFLFAGILALLASAAMASLSLDSHMER